MSGGSPSHSFFFMIMFVDECFEQLRTSDFRKTRAGLTAVGDNPRLAATKRERLGKPDSRQCG